MKVFGINLRLPNPQFRKDVIHIHDIQHILNNCDITWKGEGFIADLFFRNPFYFYF